MSDLLHSHRQVALRLFGAALKAADPVQAIHRHVVRQGNVLVVEGRPIDLNNYRRVFVVGAGKAGALMAQAMAALLGERLTDGLVIVKYGHLAPVHRVRLIEAGHPTPDLAGVDGANQMITLLSALRTDDLVFCLFSGGGSALLPAPVSGVTLAEKQAVTHLLLGCGATIQEINTIRKHISQLKGGHLARLASPARIVSLALSDVIGDPPDVIASGPTVPDPTTFADCRAIVEKYQLSGQLPYAVNHHLDDGLHGLVPETPKPGDPLFDGVQSVIVASNGQALEAAAKEASLLGYHPMILSSSIDGETREVARVYAAIGREVWACGRPVGPPACIISGGETTVTIRGKGKGGRNQEFALATAIGIAGLSEVTVFSAGTDGTDGPTDAAGAVADGNTLLRASDLGMDAVAFLNDNNAYPLFEGLDDLILTGPTNTNVMDLRLLLVGYPPSAKR